MLFCLCRYNPLVAVAASREVDVNSYLSEALVLFVAESLSYTVYPRSRKIYVMVSSPAVIVIFTAGLSFLSRQMAII